MLTDIVMPGMNGQTLAQKLAVQRSDMRTIFMSGYTGFSHSSLIQNDLTFLSKPFSKEALLQKIQETLASKEELRPAG